MVSKDLHKNNFDEPTLAKLRIFRNYVKEWLPTFIMQQHFETIEVYDLFAGPGYDNQMEQGSPIIILECIKKYFPLIKKHHTNINLYYNEYKKNKYNNLKKNCDKYLENNSHLKDIVTINYFNKDFNIVFDELESCLAERTPKLLFLDQNGVKFISEDNFNKLINYYKTDFLYFISSSYFVRFGKHDSFLKHFNIDIDNIKKSPYKFIHNNILNYYKNLIPDDSKYVLYPFSIKKGSNIYGLIFGTSNLRGVDKFLSVSWKENPINGNANFDIDDDLSAGQIDFFTGKHRKTKIELFRTSLTKNILEKRLVTNHDIYYYTIEKGHISFHAATVLRDLKRKNIIHYSGQPMINYNAVKGNKIVNISVN